MPSDTPDLDEAPGADPAVPQGAGGPRSIDVSAAGVRIDGTLIEQPTVPELTALLGPPRVVPPDPPTDATGGARSTWVVWDDAGVRVTTSDGVEAGELSVELAGDPVGHEERAARPFFPDGSFAGAFTLDGRPPVEAVPEDALGAARAFLETEVGPWDVELFLGETECGHLRRMDLPEWDALSRSGEVAATVRGAAHPFGWASVSRRTPVPVRKPSGRWTHRAPAEPVLELASFPFRLAVVQELMYEQEVLGPRFDVHDFAQDQGARSFDPLASGDRTIPAVRTWFRRLPVPARLAEAVETLVLDGGNDVYLQLAPQWDGEDGTFDIPTLTAADLAPFTRLRTVEDVGGFLGPRARAALEAAGIAVG